MINYIKTSSFKEKFSSEQTNTFLSSQELIVEWFLYAFLITQLLRHLTGYSFSQNNSVPAGSRLPKMIKKSQKRTFIIVFHVK